MKVDSDPAVRLVLCTCRCATTGARGLTVHAALAVDNGGTAGLAGCDAPCAVLAFRAVFSIVGRPNVFGIMVDMWFSLRSGGIPHFSASCSPELCQLFMLTGAVLGQGLLRACRGSPTGALVQTVQKSVPLLQFIDVLLASFLWRRGRSLWSYLSTRKRFLLQHINNVVDVLVVLVVRVPQVQFLGMVDVPVVCTSGAGRDSALGSWSVAVVATSVHFVQF